MLRSLRTKLMLSHVGLVLLAMIVLAFYLLRSADAFYLNMVQGWMREDATLFSERLGPELAAGNGGAVRQYLQSLGASVSVRVLVADSEGVIVGTTEPEDLQLVGRPGLSRGLTKALRARIEQVIPGASQPTEDVAFIVTPIDYQGKQVGALRLSYQLGDLYNQIGRLTNIILVGLAAAAGGALLVSLVLAHSLSAPARQLAVAARALSTGMLSHRIRPRGNDEIREAGRAFDALADRLQQLEQARQQLLGDVAHDIHSSITGVSMAVEALQRGAIDDPSMRRLMLEGLASHCGRLVRMADDLLEAARLEGGRLRLRRDEVNPAALLRAVAAEFSGEAVEAQVSLELRTENLLPTLWGDEQRLTQAIGNLVENALRYSPAGGRVTLGCEARKGECLLTVRDEGPGMAEQELPELFDRFKRFAEGRPGRLGFGLSIAKGLVEAHGGRIEVASTPGTGTTFTLVLPMDSETEENRNAEEQ